MELEARTPKAASRASGSVSLWASGRIADEIASAAELVMGKLNGIPGAVVRGLSVRGEGRARDLAMPRERDLFR